MKRYEVWIFLIIYSWTIASCTGQDNLASEKVNTEENSKGQVLPYFDPKATMIYQDGEGNYWFGSKEYGVYKYNSDTLILYTKDDGIAGNVILSIQEDTLGNLYFDTADGVCKFDGNQFEKLQISEDGPEAGQWKSEAGDLWFRMGWDANGPYRFDGKNLYHLQFPKNPMEVEFSAKFPDVTFNPYGLYSIFRDRKHHLWFGTSSLGIYRFDGEQLSWMYDHQLTETPAGGSFGIRSMVEDLDGFYWICNVNYKYAMLDKKTDSSGLPLIGYNRQKGIAKKEIENEYFLSMLIDHAGDLWMGSYDNGVWRKSRNDLMHYPIKDKNQNVHLLSLYLDKQGELWLNTQMDGTYKFNGQTFEKFTISG